MIQQTLPAEMLGTRWRDMVAGAGGLALAIAATWLVATSGTPAAGLLAALWFIALPHVWFHAGLHCFDIPVAAATLAVVLIYRRALHSARWALALGPALGVAISIKHNALFIPLLLGLHHLLCLALNRRRPTLPQLLPLPFLSMAVLAPLTVLALWPWLWSDPVGRVLDYVEFHRHHAYYNTEFLGINYNRPPLPIAYPFVLTWATVPTGALLLALILGTVLARRTTEPIASLVRLVNRYRKREFSAASTVRKARRQRGPSTPIRASENCASKTAWAASAAATTPPQSGHGSGGCSHSRSAERSTPQTAAHAK